MMNMASTSKPGLQQGNLFLKGDSCVIGGSFENYDYLFNFETGLLAQTKKGEASSVLDLCPDFGKGHDHLDPDESVARIQFFPTLACNMRCRYCYNASESKANTPKMQNQTIKSAIDYAITEKPQFLLTHFIGGEPTLFFQPLKYAVDYAINSAPYTDFYIVTNGTFDAKTLGFLVEHDFDVIVSLDGLREVNDKYRCMESGRSSFNIVVHNLRSLCNVEGMRILVRATLTDCSLGHFEEFLEFLADIGVSRVRCEPLLTSAGRAKENKLPLGIDIKTFADRFLAILNYAHSLGIELDTSLSKYIQLRDRRFRRPIIVLPNGDVTSSAVVCDPIQKEYDEFVYGRLNASGHFDIFPGRREKSISRFKDNSSAYCSECQIAALCGGRLRGYDFSSSRFVDAKPNVCDLYRGMLSATMHFYASLFQPTEVRQEHTLSLWDNVFFQRDNPLLEKNTKERR